MLIMNGNGFWEGTVDIRQLDYFIAAAQLGSFTKAADARYLSRQALSKAVRSLEHEVGEALFDNHDNRLELTACGRSLYREAAPVVEAFGQLEERYASVRSSAPIRRTLAVAMAHGTAISLPPQTIDRFRAQHPDVLLSVEEVTTEFAIAMVKSGESDIGLVGSAARYLRDFDTSLVVETGIHALVPNENPLAALDSLSLADLEGQPFVTFGKRNHLHRYFMDACEAAHVRPNILLTTSDAELLMRTADQQRALYFGFPRTVQPVVPSDRTLVPVDMGREEVFGTFAIRRKGMPLAPPAEWFWRHLEQVRHPSPHSTGLSADRSA